MWGGFDDHVRMVNVRAVERDQLLLMPPSLVDWLPSDHLAWFVLDVIAELDLTGFYRSLRADGRGGASYHPEVNRPGFDGDSFYWFPIDPVVAV